MTPAPVEIARKVLEGVEYFGAETILARAVVAHDGAAALIEDALADLEMDGPLTPTQYKRVLGWLREALAALSPTEGDGRNTDGR